MGGWRCRPPRDFQRRVLAQFELTNELLASINRSIINEGERQHMDLTQLQAAVAAETTVNESAVALLGQLAQLIRDAAGDPAALAALADSIEQNTQSLSDAVTANTPPEG